MIEYRKEITRQMLRDEPEKLFVFGDNFERRGLGGQAREMRGEMNAVGIATKIAPNMRESAFLTNSHSYDWLRREIPNIRRLMAHEGVIVWPADGIGTGRAQLKKRAPKIFSMIEALRKRLETHDATCSQ